MSQPRSRLIAEVYGYCGEPDDLPLKQGGLPQNLVFQILTENEDEMLRDLNLSNQGRRVSSTPVYLGQDQATFSLSVDAASAAYVTLQTDQTSQVYYPVEIVNPGALHQASLDGVLAIAFYDNMAGGEVSWNPDSQHALTIWYERTGDDNQTLSGSTELSNLYDSYLKLRTAAQCRELMNLDIGDVLKTRLTTSERQWQRYVNKGQQQGQGYKPRVFTPPRYQRSHPGIDRTRFFVP
jgi:hypothetical protein